MLFSLIDRNMYWTDTGSIRKIEKASMDGTSRKILHNTNLNYPYGLTLDIDTQTLYWVDQYRSVIEKSSVDGTNRIVVTRTMVSRPYFITFYRGILYWYDRGYYRIQSIAISSPSIVTTYPSTNAYGMEVIAPQRQGQY